jgi:hypothetical protein
MDILDIITQPTPPGSPATSSSELSDPLAGEGSEHEDELPSLTSTLRKRRAEDDTNFALTTSRNVRLKTDDEKSVLRFAQVRVPRKKSLQSLFAHLLHSSPVHSNVSQCMLS